MVSLRERVPEKQPVPVRVVVSERGYVVVLGIGVAFESREVPESGPYLPDDPDHRIDHGVVLQRLLVLLCRELVPQLVLPSQFLCGVHQVQCPLRLDGEGESVVVADPHPSRLTLLRGHDDHTVGGPGAVDRRSRRILQDGDALDVVGVDVADAVHEYVVEPSGRKLLRTERRGVALHRHAVHHPERLAGPREVVGSSNPDPGLCSRLP